MIAFQQEGKLLLTDQASIDEAQSTGRWISYVPRGGRR